MKIRRIAVAVALMAVTVLMVGCATSDSTRVRHEESSGITKTGAKFTETVDTHEKREDAISYVGGLPGKVAESLIKPFVGHLFVIQEQHVGAGYPADYCYEPQPSYVYEYSPLVGAYVEVSYDSYGIRQYHRRMPDDFCPPGGRQGLSYRDLPPNDGSSHDDRDCGDNVYHQGQRKNKNK